LKHPDHISGQQLLFQPVTYRKKAADQFRKHVPSFRNDIHREICVTQLEN
jgi:hypothetical protein